MSVGRIAGLRRVARPFSFLILLLVLVAGLELSAAVATEFMSAQEGELARLVNSERVARGLPTLSNSDALRTVARRHSQRMLGEGQIFHNQRLQQEVQAVFPDWARVGENVGVGPNIPAVHRAFMESPTHRANVMDSGFHWLGVGVISGGSRLYMTQNFLQLQSGATRPVPAQFRLAGRSRLSTAKAVADFGFTPGTAGGAVLAPAYDFHGALAGAALAGAINGPVVLSGTAELAPEARDALLRALGSTRSTKTVYLVGGPFAGAVRDAVASLGVRVATVGGSDHAATAVQVARTLPQRPSAAFIATVTSYPDALAASAVSAVTGWPVLYTSPTQLSSQTASALRELGIRRTYVLGGSSAVSDAVVGQLAGFGAPAARRLAGANRVQTALVIADFALQNGLKASAVEVATAYNYPDALAGGALARVVSSPVLLTTSRRLDPSVGAWLRAHRASVGGVYLLGGSGALATAVEADIAYSLR